MKQYAILNSSPRKFADEFSILSNSNNNADFLEDYIRLISSTAFRRMEYKTQVFVNHAGDHYRNRLTHSLEVSAIAKLISVQMNLCDTLAEIIALAHDIGHGPFGHVGEDALHDCMKNHGGFCHNTNGFKIITKLEKRYANFNGLNLTWESLEGIAKHNGPITKQTPENSYIFQYDKEFNLDLANFSSLEAQTAAIADDIAYNAHDIEDGIRANFFELKDLQCVGIINEIVEEIDRQYPNLEKMRKVYEFKRRFIKILVEDVCSHGGFLIKENNIENSLHVRSHKSAIMSFSPQINSEINQIRKFLSKEMYSHPKVEQSRKHAFEVVSVLFNHFLENQNKMPNDWNLAEFETAEELISDYVAGMTDRYAIKKYNEILGLPY